jgi:protein-L-isoaspartate(D-aspartate) O-methyltransferase
MASNGVSGDNLSGAWKHLLFSLELRGHLASPRIRQAMEKHPRWRFLGSQATPELVQASLADSPVGIAHGQTISAPHMVAILLSAADPRPGERALEVGAGSGWLLVLLTEMLGPEGHAVGVEVVPELVQLARYNLHATGVWGRAEVHEADGGLGHPAGGPYDIIIVSCAAPRVPEPLVDQLKPGGRLVIPVGERDVQHLLRITKTEDGLHKEDLGRCAFVPLVGAWGF